jgi:hypothetical protein
MLLSEREFNESESEVVMMMIDEEKDGLWYNDQIFLRHAEWWQWGSRETRLLTTWPEKWRGGSISKRLMQENKIKKEKKKPY